MKKFCLVLIFVLTVTVITACAKNNDDAIQNKYIKVQGILSSDESSKTFYIDVKHIESVEVISKGEKYTIIHTDNGDSYKTTASADDILSVIGCEIEVINSSKKSISDIDSKSNNEANNDNKKASEEINTNTSDIPANNPNDKGYSIVDIEKVELMVMTTNLQVGKDGKTHYAVITGSLSINTKDADYPVLGTMVEKMESDIESIFISDTAAYTYEHLLSVDGKKEVKEKILSDIQDLFDSKMIVDITLDYLFQ